MGLLMIALAIASVALTALLFGAIATFSARPKTTSTLSPPVKLIIDTDIGGGGCTDVDDVAAICMAHAMMDNGEADILAIILDIRPPPCAGAISVLNHYYGRDDIPIGAYKGTDLGQPENYHEYIDALNEHWDSPIKSSHEVPDSVSVYREVLAAADDGSVVISSIGLMTSLATLLKSTADAFSPMTGRNLVEKKVKQLFIMGGHFPFSPKDESPECNLCGCAWADKSSARAATAASHYVVNNWPSSAPILWSGAEVGSKVQSGGLMSRCQPGNNPCRRAYETYLGGPRKTRHSWDPLTTLVAVRGFEGLGVAPCSHCHGRIVVNRHTGHNHWRRDRRANQTYLVLNDNITAGNAVDALLCQRPAKNRDGIVGGKEKDAVVSVLEVGWHVHDTDLRRRWHTDGM